MKKNQHINTRTILPLFGKIAIEKTQQTLIKEKTLKTPLNEAFCLFHKVDEHVKEIDYLV